MLKTPENDPPTQLITVEVAYATPEKQKIIAVEVEPGCPPLQAAQQSGIEREFEGIDLDAAKMGVFGKAVDPRTYRLQAGERVEIYRPLLIDPKAVRKARAEKARAET
ncbi:MAG: RnfH family protein [Gammaproteobacteria bacterium]|nr:RnfH family protein [Gammaproteobacteria bacterium]NND38668.1 RnfH family protein [Pseudomonadales bacterium]MBT8150928.1 RnfH family protein [Gammaproteobacteria bacterium]NNL11349.1 RnfH family protein [Pseudomonadales bacterium]NNM11028.1 RnfH family protein [Pseudomonadales bacterium]